MKKRESELWSRRIAAFIYATAVLETTEGSYIVSEGDIEKHFGNVLPKDWTKSKAFINKIKEELFNYPGISGGPNATSVDDSQVEVYKDGVEWQFDLDLFTDYTATSNEDEDDDESII